MRSRPFRLSRVDSYPRRVTLAPSSLRRAAASQEAAAEREQLRSQVAALRERVAESRAERGQLEHWKQVRGGRAAAPVWMQLAHLAWAAASAPCLCWAGLRSVALFVALLLFFKLGFVLYCTLGYKRLRLGCVVPRLTLPPRPLVLPPLPPAARVGARVGARASRGGARGDRAARHAGATPRGRGDAGRGCREATAREQRSPPLLPPLLLLPSHARAAFHRLPCPLG
jgi:hypothetical protein